MVGIEEKLVPNKLPQLSTVKQISYQKVHKYVNYHEWIAEQQPWQEGAPKNIQTADTPYDRE